MKVYLEDIDHNIFMPLVNTFKRVYAYGWLELKVGNDIIYLEPDINQQNLTDEVYKVIAVTPDGCELPSFLYFWHDNRGHQHGLVCAANDSMAQDCARSVFEKRMRHI